MIEQSGVEKSFLKWNFQHKKMFALSYKLYIINEITINFLIIIFELYFHYIVWPIYRIANIWTLNYDYNWLKGEG